MAVIINGRDLTVEQVIAVCRHHEKVEIAPEAVEAVKKARAYVEQKVADKAVVYGLTTGFGKFANVSISTEETAQLLHRCLISIIFCELFNAPIQAFQLLSKRLVGQ